MTTTLSLKKPMTPPTGFKQARDIRTHVPHVPQPGDVSPDLAPEHRGRADVEGLASVAATAIAAYRATPAEPKATHGLRVALAVAEALPSQPVWRVQKTLRDVVKDETAEQAKRDEAAAISRTLSSTIGGLRLARFRAAFAAAAEIVEPVKRRAGDIWKPE